MEKRSENTWKERPWEVFSVPSWLYHFCFRDGIGGQKNPPFSWIFHPLSKGQSFPHPSSFSSCAKVTVESSDLPEQMRDFFSGAVGWLVGLLLYFPAWLPDTAALCEQRYQLSPHPGSDNPCCWQRGSKILIFLASCSWAGTKWSLCFLSLLSFFLLVGKGIMEICTAVTHLVHSLEMSSPPEPICSWGCAHQ